MVVTAAWQAAGLWARGGHTQNGTPEQGSEQGHGSGSEGPGFTEVTGTGAGQGAWEKRHIPPTAVKRRHPFPTRGVALGWGSARAAGDLEGWLSGPVVAPAEAPPSESPQY